MKPKLLTQALVGIALLLAFGSTATAETVDTYQQGVGVPTGSSTADKPLKIKYTIMVNGKPVTKTVEVAGIKKWQYTKRGANETIKQWHDRLAGERAAATVEKSKLIVDAINAKFANEFAALGQTAAAATYSQKDRDYPDSPAQTWGRVDWPSGQPTKTDVPAVAYQPPDPTKQPLGGGLQRIPGSPGSSMGMSGSMGRGSGFPTSFASGLDGNGQPSYVDAGYVNGFFATVYPSEGRSDDLVLADLASQLNANGIKASYDTTLVRLTLTDPVPDGVAFGFGNTDQGLDFEFVYQSLAAVPEPGAPWMLGAGLLLGLMARARRKSG